MNIKNAGVAAAALAAASAAACAQEPPAAAPARTIAVTGAGETTATPDMAVLRLGVRTDAPSAAAALRGNSTAMQTTIKTLKDAGVADRDIQTTGLSINPRYDYNRNNEPPRLIGYTAANAVSVRLRDLDKAGAVIDQAVQSGANSIDGVTLTFADPAPLYDAAREDAVKKAKAEAELYARAAGVRLGQVLSITDGAVGGPVPVNYAAVRAAPMAEASVPMEAGESTISASVSMVFEIE